MARRTPLLLATAALAAAAAVAVFLVWRAPAPADSQDAAAPDTSESQENPEALFAALEGESDPVKKRDLVDRLGRLPDGVDHLKRVLDEFNDAAVEEQAVVAASRRGDEASIRLLAEVASNDERVGARAAAALAKVESRTSAPELLRLATSDEPPLVRINAARALGRSGDAAQSPALADLVSDGAQPQGVRQAAALALRDIGADEAAAPLAAALENLAADTGDEAEQLRIAIVQALGALSHQDAREALEAYATRDLSPTERSFLDRAQR